MNHKRREAEELHLSKEQRAKGQKTRAGKACVDGEGKPMVRHQVIPFDALRLPEPTDSAR